jgi:catechol 2,3-dioxygenase-like lactoylglutathione lyase family enzyme
MSKHRDAAGERTTSVNDRPPFEFEGIDHLLLLVDGMPKALAFYCDVLGCGVEAKLPEFAMVQLRTGNALIDLVDIGSPEGKWARPKVAGGRNLDHLCIAISKHDEQQLRSHLEAHEIAIVEAGVHGGARGDSLSIYVQDPSGNTIELKGPPAKE